MAELRLSEGEAAAFTTLLLGTHRVRSQKAARQVPLTLSAKLSPSGANTTLGATAGTGGRSDAATRRPPARGFGMTSAHPYIEAGGPGARRFGR